MYTKIFPALLTAAGFALALPTTGIAQTPGGASDQDTAQAERFTLMAEGARVFANNCSRCHNLRASTERSDAQWRVIVAHMRTRANLTRSEAEAVNMFLQMTNRDGDTASAVPPAASSSSVPVEETAAVLQGLTRPDR